MTSVLIHFSNQEKAIVFKKRLQKKYDEQKPILITTVLWDYINGVDQKILNPFYDKNFIRRKY